MYKRQGIELVRVSRISYTVIRAQVSRKNLQRLRKLLQNEAQIRIRQKKEMRIRDRVGGNG